MYLISLIYILKKELKQFIISTLVEMIIGAKLNYINFILITYINISYLSNWFLLGNFSNLILIQIKKYFFKCQLLIKQ